MRCTNRCVTAIVAGGLLFASPPVSAGIGGPPMRDMTPNEATAHAVWSLRAALNVAALQCQFSPFLATVSNYNDLLKQHDVELANAYKAMENHFRRHDGANGRKTFDVFTTRMYNSFSALDAQRSFCATAGTVGREGRALPRGMFANNAGAAVERIRASLIAPLDPYRIVTMTYLRIPAIPDPCLDKRGRPMKRCKL